jgi:hypothetical protein
LSPKSEVLHGPTMHKNRSKCGRNNVRIADELGAGERINCRSCIAVYKAEERERDRDLWLAHDDSNKVDVLYSGYGDTPKARARYFAKLIREGLTIRKITDADGARRAWGHILTENEMRAIAAPPGYDLDHGSAAQIANVLAGVK